MSKLVVNTKKVLKLNNVIIRTIYTQEELVEFEKIVYLMDSYLRSKGAKAVGPLIQYTNNVVNDDGSVKTRIQFMLQADKYIYHLDEPYIMKSVIRVQNCYYIRFEGDASKLNIAQHKLLVEAYENEEELKGDSYTIFLGSQEEDKVLVDIFMEYN